MSYRDDLAALTARRAALEGEVAAKTRELEHATRLLEEARTRARLPVLDNIKVASPCSADWAEMAGDDRVRHCGDCQRSGYNLSGMTRDEAEALIVEKEGRLCVRYFERADGTILLADDCEVGARSRQRRRRRNTAIAAAAAALIGAAGALAGRSPRAVMGAMAPRPEIERAMRERMGKYDGAPRPTLAPKAEVEAAKPPRPPLKWE
jgi:hypothetical protein